MHPPGEVADGEGETHVTDKTTEGIRTTEGISGAGPALYYNRATFTVCP